MDEKRLLSGRAGQRVLGRQAEVMFGAKHGIRSLTLDTPSSQCQAQIAETEAANRSPSGMPKWPFRVSKPPSPSPSLGLSKVCAKEERG